MQDNLAGVSICLLFAYACWATVAWVHWRFEAAIYAERADKFSVALTNANDMANANADAYAKAKAGSAQAIKRLTQCAEAIDKFTSEMDREADELKIAIHQYANTWAS